MERAPSDIEIDWGVKIPMRDGIHLNATLYAPDYEETPAPVIVALTPYIADHLHNRACDFAKHGMRFLAVDVRGRGNSEGAFRPMIQEAHDGYDTVEWVARQSFCNGKVGMYCGSYLGYCQWATAKESPAHLVTIVPTAAPYFGVDFPMRNNIFYPYLAQWMIFVRGKASQLQTFSDSTFWSAFYRHWHESGQSFEDIGAILGKDTSLLDEWLQHPEQGPYWDAYNPTAEQYARLQIPILTITGAYDDDQPGALEHYRQHVRHASPAAQRNHYLIIGPWNHYGTGFPQREVGGVKLGEASVIDIPRLHREWYAWTMDKGAKPAFLKERVCYYVMGAECWRYADTLEEITREHLRYFLDSRGSATDLFASGSMRDAPGEGPPDHYRFDPRETRGPEVDAEAQTDACSLVDQRLTVALRGKQLIYHSEPFDKDTEISGFLRLTAWISIDCPDTDLYVSVHEVLLDGSSIRLSTDAIRARYRESLRCPRLIDTEQPLRYDFDRFTFVSRVVKRGHRLRLILAPMGRLIDSTFAQKNYNGGGIISQETVADARAVTVRLYHDADHPSVLHVPIGREADDAK
jgi:uncharacterized protein